MTVLVSKTRLISIGILMCFTCQSLSCLSLFYFEAFNDTESKCFVLLSDHVLEVTTGADFL